MARERGWDGNGCRGKAEWEREWVGGWLLLDKEEKENQTRQSFRKKLADGNFARVEIWLLCIMLWGVLKGVV